MTSKNNDTEETGLEDFFQPDMHIEDHDYDEIKELDNPSPGWIMAIFYLTIGIAILYGAYYFWLKVGDQQEAEYTKSVQVAQEKYKSTAPAGPMAQLSDAASLDEGKQIYMAMNCQACHGTAGEGNAVGPNLTDDHYLHGCKFDDIFSTIKNGFPAKGMTSFKAQLSDQKIQQVTSYVMSLKGTNPPGAKEPQGEICN